MSNMQVDAVLAQIRSLSSQIRPAGAPAAPGVEAAQKPQESGFASLIRQGVDSVNQSQQRATEVASAFERGEPGVELSQVMLEMQKASVSFRAVTEVRNRFVNAYQEIMNMPI